MGMTIKLVAWTLAIALTAGVAYVFFAALRWPVRVWRRGEHKRAIVLGFGVTLGLLVWVALSQIVP
jgi:apolipoprotein N-acyltransferase